MEAGLDERAQAVHELIYRLVLSLKDIFISYISKLNIFYLCSVLYSDREELENRQTELREKVLQRIRHRVTPHLQHIRDEVTY